jgi:hypothetical protein
LSPELAIVQFETNLSFGKAFHTHVGPGDDKAPVLADVANLPAKQALGMDNHDLSGSIAEKAGAPAALFSHCAPRYGRIADGRWSPQNDLFAAEACSAYKSLLTFLST